MRQFPLSSSSNGGRTAEDQLAYLEAILRRTGSGSGLRPRTSVEVRWDNASTLLARVAMERKKIGDVYERTLNELIRAGRMTTGEARAASAAERHGQRFPTLPPPAVARGAHGTLARIAPLARPGSGKLHRPAKPHRTDRRQLTRTDPRSSIAPTHVSRLAPTREATS